MTVVKFDPLAQHELTDAISYYDSKGEGLGDAILFETTKALRRLSMAPLSCPVVRSGIRRRPLFRFPFSILYRVNGDLVTILAFLHQRRGPKYIAARLRPKDTGDVE